MFSALQKRSIGQQGARPLNFQQSAASSLDLVGRLELRTTLEGHGGCVNTVSFSDDGEILVSGSDDRRVMLWNWYTGGRITSYRSGHNNNIFQARFLPNTNNSTIVTCAADGQVRIGYLRGDGSTTATTLLATHGSRAHKLALDPTNPVSFYSCGEDGRVFHYDMRCPQARQSLLVCTKTDSQGGRERLELHSIHCNPLRPWQFAVGGGDIFVRVYDQRHSLTPTGGGGNSHSYSTAALSAPVRRLAPHALRSKAGLLSRGELACTITCAVFSRRGEILASYNDENIYLFASEGPLPTQARPEGPSEVLAANDCRRRVSSIRRRGASEQGVPGTSRFRSLNEVQGTGGSNSSEADMDQTAANAPPPSRLGSLRLQREAASGQGSAQVEAGPSNDARSGQREFNTAHHAGESASERLGQEPRPAVEAGRSAESPAGSLQEGNDLGGSGEGSSGEEASSSQPGSEDIESESEEDDSDGSQDDYEDENALAGEWGFESSDDDSHGYLLGDAYMHRGDFSPPIPSDQDLEAQDSSEREMGDGSDAVLQKFTGHRNCRTVKGVSFLGESEEYVMSGSDDGHIYIWSASDGILRQWLPGDMHVVNCLEPSPVHPLSFATSGIEDDIKLWTPTAGQSRPVPEAAALVMSRNRRSQGPHRLPSTSARRILLRLQQMAEAREGRANPGGGDGTGIAAPGGCGVQ